MENEDEDEFDIGHKSQVGINTDHSIHESCMNLRFLPDSNRAVFLERAGMYYQDITLE
jgi:hypothetical protein